MKRHIGVLSLCMLFAVSTATAEKIPNDNGEVHVSDAECDVAGYEIYASDIGGEIPDSDPAGLLLGPLEVPENGTVFEDVILGVNISHTWVGDLRISLLYDTDCDGVAEVEASVICRPALDGCPVDGCCGCSGDVNGLYLFDDDEPGEPWEDCQGDFMPGCYGPDLDSTGLSVLDGWPQGSCFWLSVQDGAGGDTGHIEDWSVATINTPGGTPTEATTWSAIKTRF